MKIHPVIKPRNKSRHNRYCGPCALSILTGQDTGQCASIIRLLSGVHAVTGTSAGQIFNALNWFGYRVDKAHYPTLMQEGEWDTGARASNGEHAESSTIEARKNWKKCPTLASWLKQTKDIRTTGRVFLVCAGWHWQVISGRRYACGLTQDIVSVRKAPHRRARVTGVWEIMKV